MFQNATDNGADNICRALPRGSRPRMGARTPPSSVTSPTSKTPRAIKTSGRVLNIHNRVFLLPSNEIQG